MVKNQLFRILPDTEIIHSLLNAFGLTSLDDTKFFTKESLKDNETVTRINEMKDKLEGYYLPCKAKDYMNNITEKRSITILRQFIKSHDYTLISKERYIDGKKISVYRLIQDDKNLTPTKKKKKKKIVINFE